MENNTKERILSQAALLFHQKGYAATSMREIASAVGIEASSLYNHITSKEQLLEEICFSVSRAFQESILRIPSSVSDPLEKLQHIFRFHIDLSKKDQTAVTAFNDEWRHLSTSSRSKFGEERKSYENFVQKIIIDGQKLGIIKPELSAVFVTKTLLSSVRWLYFMKDGQNEANTDEIMSQWTKLIFNGIVN